MNPQTPKWTDRSFEDVSSVTQHRDDKHFGTNQTISLADNVIILFTIRKVIYLRM